MNIALRYFIHLSFRFLFFLAFLGCAILLTIARPFLSNINKKSVSVAPNSAALRQYVSILSQEFQPRDWSHPENLERAAVYIKEQLGRSTSNVSLQSYSVEGRKYHNVLAHFGSEAGQRVIVGAHYDAFDKYPGADDNASGVAGLLELARFLSSDPVSVPVTLAAFTLEEPPYFRTAQMGSAVHAASLKKALVPVKLMISLEMIGYFNDSAHSQQLPFFPLRLVYPSTGNFIAIIDRINFSRASIDVKRAFLESTNLATYSMNAPTNLPGIDFSDHLNFWAAGYPALMISDTAFFRNHAYHTAEDTADRLDYERMGEVVKGVYAYLSSLKN